MARSVWYVGPDGQKVTWASAVVNGKAAVEISRIVQDDAGYRQELWRRTGAAVDSYALSAAQAEQASAAVPTAATAYDRTNGGRVAVTGVALAAGRYYHLQPGGQATVAPTLNLLVAIPFTPARSCTIDYLGVNVTAAGTATTLRLQVVKAGSNGLPDLTQPVGGEVTVATTATGVKDLAPSVPVTAGVAYWLLVVQQGTTAGTLTSAEANRTDIGPTTKPVAAFYTGFSDALVGGASVTGVILNTAQTTWDNTVPTKPIKVICRAST